VVEAMRCVARHRDEDRLDADAEGAVFVVAGSLEIVMPVWKPASFPRARLPMPCGPSCTFRNAPTPWPVPWL
jgi:hypothetical protein